MRSSGIQIEFTRNITIYTFYNHHPETVDQWAAHHQNALETTAPDTPHYILVDTLSPGVQFTPYVRERSQQILLNHRDRLLHIALTYKTEEGKRLLQMFFAVQPGVQYKVHICNSRESGLAWLYEQQKKTASA